MSVRRWRNGLLGIACLCLGACASVQRSHHQNSPDARTRECAALFVALDADARRARVRDAGETPVLGYPYLRTSRFTASLNERAQGPEARAAWLEMLRSLDLHARRFELRNQSPAGARAVVEQKIDECGKHLVRLDALESRQGLEAAVRVPDDYQTWKRALGLYALARVPFAHGVRNYQREAQRVFDTPIEALPIHGTLVRYGPQETPAPGIAPMLLSAPALGLPSVAPAHLGELLLRHAPLFEVDESGPYDRAGALGWSEDNQLAVDGSRPTVYYRAQFTRHGDRALLQLQYTLWFPERPRKGAFDLLGGRLDGVVWRVTLDARGNSVLYDSIHPCGCYHQFFPTPSAILKPAPDSLDEYAFVPQRLRPVGASDRVLIRLATRSHYIERVLVGAQADNLERRYHLEPEDSLRALPYRTGYRSAYGPDGIMPGSERGERFVFWPMGIASPGAMRQSGRQATAFVGRRHFDDARLLERYFDLTP